MRKIILYLILIFNMSQSLVAQEVMFKGKVCTFDSIPVVGASIQVKSTKQVYKSDSLGLFTIRSHQKDKIRVTAEGFSSKNLKIEESAKDLFVNLKLKPGTSNKEAAISSGHVKNKEKLYAAASINKNAMDFSQYISIYEIIRGRFSGVEISGGDIIVRGTSTFISSSAALLVVDGVIVDQELFSNILPVEITSISILKDAGAAEYGSRGANGVVLVQTKMTNGL